MFCPQSQISNIFNLGNRKKTNPHIWQAGINTCFTCLLNLWFTQITNRNCIIGWCFSVNCKYCKYSIFTPTMFYALVKHAGHTIIPKRIRKTLLKEDIFPLHRKTEFLAYSKSHWVTGYLPITGLTHMENKHTHNE